jgi:ribosomal protein S18 acetylase RimI-like enzyme
MEYLLFRGTEINEGSLSFILPGLIKITKMFNATIDTQKTSEDGLKKQILANKQAIVVARNYRIDHPVNNICGIGTLWNHGGKWELDYIYVRTQDRNKGVGGTMIDILVEEASDHRIRDLHVYISSKSRFLIRSLSTRGFISKFPVQDMYLKLK